MNGLKRIIKSSQFFLLLTIFAGCGLNPQNADIELNETLPETQVTVYQNAIDQLGLMSSVYADAPLKIMLKEIIDKTGTSFISGAEIPKNITEMVKSTLNSIGGNVVFIPYDPLFMMYSNRAGYTQWRNKIVPQVILDGGITEFDRGLVTDDDSFNIVFKTTYDREQYGLNFSDADSQSLSSVTLDFNLINFNTFAGIPRMQAINGIKLHKAAKKDDIGFTIQSISFGAKGDIKKVQGRHAAVRLLVQLSMIQIIGRYQKLPYWHLIPGAKPDKVVIDRVLNDFFSLTKTLQTAKTQELLYLHGFKVTPNGELDDQTQSALQDFASKHRLGSGNLDPKIYLALYENVPISRTTLQRRRNLIPPEPVVVAQVDAIPDKRDNPTELTKSISTNSKQFILATDKPTYKIGDALKVTFSVSEPMYVRIVVINSKGQIDTVFPNTYQRDNYCIPGKTYSIPSKGAGFSVEIVGPVGIDKLRGIASSSPIPENTVVFTKTGPFDEKSMVKYPVHAAIEYEVHS